MEVFVILFYLLFCLIPAFIASKKGRNPIGYFFLCFAISPLGCLILTLCLKKAPPREKTVTASGKVSIRETCESLRGDSDKLKTLLDDAVDKELITPSQSASLYQEFMRPLVTEPPVTEPTDALPEGSSPSVGFCRHCGAAIVDGGRFCRKCGTPVTVSPSETVTDNA